MSDKIKKRQRGHSQTALNSRRSLKDDKHPVALTLERQKNPRVDKIRHLPPHKATDLKTSIPECARMPKITAILHQNEQKEGLPQWKILVQASQRTRHALLDICFDG